MVRIGILSDTHGYLDESIIKHLSDCDEIWHAGDVGSFHVIDELKEICHVRAVYGNIDGRDIRLEFPKMEIFNIEEVKVVMIHIGGYPNRYEKGVKAILLKEKPTLFISGHSHILKVIYDKKLDLLHINPGAAGKLGFQQVRTLIRFQIDKKEIKNLEIIEMKR